MNTWSKSTSRPLSSLLAARGVYMLTLSLMVAMAPRWACEGCTGQGAGGRARARPRPARPAPPPRPGVWNTLRLALAGAALRQSITCLIFTYSTHENRKPKIGITAMPTPTAARMIRCSRMWFVNCRMQPWNWEERKRNYLVVYISISSTKEMTDIILIRH